ncbi:cation:proton antiporter [Candidatus Micrarchaeota archaeon]|nr:cation:proton antiporter [Candidatus Micrarchaeota archaeon]
MPTSLESTFLIFGSIIIIGYLGELVSKRFSLPSALFLLLIGQTLRLSGYADAGALISIQEIFGTLALVILLFDGGVSLNLNTLMFRSGRVVMVGALITLFAIAACSTFFYYVLGTDPLIGAIFGALAGGIGSATTLSIVRGLSLPRLIEDFLTMESSVTDVFSIILTIVFTGALVSGSLDLQFLGSGVASRFSVGVVLGAAMGILSLAILSKIEKGYDFVITFALTLMLFAICELLGGSGAMAVLVFGVTFGNEKLIRRALRFGDGERHFTSRAIQAEISFFIRTFFLVFLGVVVELGSVTNLVYALGLIILLYAIRFIVIRLILQNSQFSVYADVLCAMNPRGLATAVLATYPIIAVSNALKVGPDARLFLVLGQLDSLPEITFYVIILSVLITSLLVPLAVSALAHAEAKKKKKAPKASS